MSTVCNLTISDLTLPQFCENVTSGVRRLLFVPKDDVAAINAVVTSQPDEMDEYVVVGSPAMMQRAVELNSGCEFAEIFAQRDLGELKYTEQGGVTGNRSFHATVEIHHPVFRRKVLGFLGIAVNLEFVLLVQLSNGDWHLLGDLERGAALADGVEATSGKAAADQHGATLTFGWDTPMPRVFFSGWSPDDPICGVEMYHLAWLLADENDDLLVDENDIPLEITIY